MRNAHIRMVQPNPTLGMRRETIIGKMTPPILDPVNTIPNAAARLRLNHPARQVIASTVSSCMGTIKRLYEGPTRVKDGRYPDCRAQALREKDLVIFSSEAGHHNAEDVHKASDQE